MTLGGAGGAFWYLRGTAAVAPQPAPVVAVAVVNDKVKITFTSTPSGAKVVRADGTVIGATPVKLEVAKDAGDLDVAFVLDGYNQQRRRVVPDDDKELLVMLQPKEAPPVAVAPEHSSHHSSSHHRASSTGTSASGLPVVDDARLLRSSLLDDPAPKH